MISTQARAALHEVLLQAALRGERAKAERLLDDRAKAMARRLDAEIKLDSSSTVERFAVNEDVAGSIPAYPASSNRVPLNPTEGGVNTHERATSRA